MYCRLLHIMLKTHLVWVKYRVKITKKVNIYKISLYRD